MAMTQEKYDAVRQAMIHCGALQPGPLRLFHEQIDDLAAEDLALLIARDIGFHGDQVRRVLSDALHAKLDLMLVREHVAAQQKMSDAADALQIASLSIARSSLLMNVATGVISLVALILGVLALKH